MRKCAIGLFGLLLTCVVYAADAPTYTVAIAGVGTDKCSVWVSDPGATSASSQETIKRRIEWLFGFLSGVNLFGERSGHLKGGVDDPDGALKWIDNYCRAHPEDPVWAAAGALVLDLRNHPRQ